MTAQHAQTLYHNPVLPGFHPDPSICRAGNLYYLVVSSFEYFPGIPIFVSEDLVDWRPIGHVLDRTSQLNLLKAPDSGGIYAPTIRFHNGTFFVASTNVSDGGHFIVHSTDPAGAWSDPVCVAQNGIDPSLYFEGDDVYFSSNVEPDPGGQHALVPDFRRGIQQSLIDPFSGKILRGPEFIWEGTGARYPEGPHLFERGGWYYLVIAEGGTEYGHFVSVGRSRSPWGPFQASPHGPLIDHRSAISPLSAVGHADLAETPHGKWWLTCHGIRPTSSWGLHVLGRETLLAPITWKEDGWPGVGEHGLVPVTGPRPLPSASGERHTDRGQDDFNKPRLGDEWTFVRRPMQDADLLRSPGQLTLQADAADIEGPFPCFIGRRQQHIAFRATASLTRLPSYNGEQAGLIIRMNRTHFFFIAARRSGEHVEIVLRQRAAHLDFETVLGIFDGTDIEFGAEGQNNGSYILTAHGRGHLWRTSALSSALLSTELAGGFTGVLIGMFATSPSAPSAPVAFDRFQYEPIRTEITLPITQQSTAKD